MDSTLMPPFLFIDAALLSYRLGKIRFEEQKTAMLAAARAATDSITYMSALETFGVNHWSPLHDFVGHFLAAPEYYRAKYPAILGLRAPDEPPTSFLEDQRTLFLTEAILTEKQQKTFFEAYWWFVHNHEATYYDRRKGRSIGLYATEPKDNVSVVAHFEQYLQRLANHKTKYIRERYEGFPLDIVVALVRRTYL
ncbi:MAG: hypothetical protein K6C30_03320 [Bacteroidaceae bacterium]|nr:hypothetical protein [Bacteroidaceae bacterium]